MLTASLQSTWDTQRNLQRPKYGNNYQLNYMNSSYNGNNNTNYITNSNNNGQPDDKNGGIRSNYQQPTYDSGNYPELPNLKVSNQVMYINQFYFQAKIIYLSIYIKKYLERQSLIVSNWRKWN